MSKRSVEPNTLRRVVSFSMGRSSARAALLAIDKFGPGNVDLVLMDTGAEHPLSYKFAKDMIEHFGVEVVCLRGDYSFPLGKGVGFHVVPLSECKPDLKPFKEMIAKYGVPYIGGMFCSERLKSRPYKKYCDATYGKKNYQTILGMRIDEPTRLKKKPFVSYLADLCDDDKQDVINFWRKQVFDLGIDEWLGNCVFCPKKSKLKLAAAQRDEPEMYEEWISMLKHDSVRIDEKTGHWTKMYRGSQPLESLIAAFDGFTGKEIKARIRGSKMLDTGSCSESCEPAPGEFEFEDE